MIMTSSSAEVASLVSRLSCVPSASRLGPTVELFSVDDAVMFVACVAVRLVGNVTVVGVIVGDVVVVDVDVVLVVTKVVVAVSVGVGGV